MWVADSEHVRRVVGLAREVVAMPDAPLERVVGGVEAEAVWLLIALAGHERRQRWLADVVVGRLGGDLRQIGRMGAFGHPEERPQSGTVPDLPEWEYYFHGIGCCLTNKVDGTTIDVDFDPKGGCEAIDPYFYRNHLENTRAPSLAEERIRHPRPCDEAWMTDLPALVEAGCLDGSGWTRLTERGREFAIRLLPVVEAIDQCRRDGRYAAAAMLAAMLGDARFAVRLLREAPEPGMCTPPAWLESLAARQAADRADALVRRIDAAEGAGAQDVARLAAQQALQALAAMGRSYAAGKVTMLVAKRDPDPLLATAVEILEAWGDPRGLEDFVLGVLLRSGGEQAPRPHLRLMVCRMLLRDVRRRTSSYFRKYIVPALEEEGHWHDGEMALLLYVVDRAKGLGKLGRALGHRVPMARSDAAAALALIGTPDAVRVLIDFVRALGPVETREARAAVMECAAPEAWEVVRKYERENPEPALERKTIHLGGREHEVSSFEDLQRSWAAEAVRHTLEKWRETYAWISADV